MSSPCSSIRASSDGGGTHSVAGTSRFSSPFHNDWNRLRMDVNTCAWWQAYARRPSLTAGSFERITRDDGPPRAFHIPDQTSSDTSVRLASSLRRRSSSFQRSFRAYAFDHSMRKAVVKWLEKSPPSGGRTHIRGIRELWRRR